MFSTPINYKFWSNKNRSLERYANGTIVIKESINGQDHKQSYLYYSQQQAIKKFNEYLKEGE